MDFSIRRFGDGDSIEALTELLHAAYRDLGDAGWNYTAVDQTPETTASRIAGAVCLVAQLDGRLIGTIALSPPDPDEEVVAMYREPGVGAIHQFGVHPDWQGKGVGRALHEAAVEVARVLGLEWLALDTAAPAGHLIEIYRSWGYEIASEFQWPGKNYPSVAMKRPVDASQSTAEPRPDRYAAETEASKK